MPNIKPPRFSADDADKAYEAWGANCGPTALAAIAGLTLDEVRPYMGDFEAKHYTNPTLMWAALCSIGKPWYQIGRSWPRHGLVRIQWEGPWTDAGVPPQARYRYTHWIGAAITEDQRIGVFDINCIDNGTGWTALDDWKRLVVPALTGLYPKASGGWHVTHGVEVSPP